MGKNILLSNHYIPKGQYGLIERKYSESIRSVGSWQEMSVHEKKGTSREESLLRLEMYTKRITLFI